jgi:hypothetical protein
MRTTGKTPGQGLKRRPVPTPQADVLSDLQGVPGSGTQFRTRGTNWVPYSSRLWYAGAETRPWRGWRTPPTEEGAGER